MPGAVFPEEFLRPEKQDLAVFAAGVEAITEAQRSVALNYFEDGSVEAACPPIKALLHIMAYGEYQGVDETDTGLLRTFTREAMLESEWYRDRLRAKQQIDIALWTRHVASIDEVLRSSKPVTQRETKALFASASEQLARVKSESYLAELVGTIGADPSVLA